jgi:DNA-binding NtrC family response regulator
MQTAKKIRILVVDDEPTLADTLAIIFQRAGYIATAVYGGQEALTSIEAYRPSLVVTDVIMPGFDGITLAKKIQTCCPDCKVLLFSGNADTQNLLESAQRDGHSFEVLAKPVPPPQMLAKVALLLEQSSCPQSK